MAESTSWYALDAANQPYPVGSVEEVGMLHGWREGDRVDPREPHGVRPCTWERVAWTEEGEWSVSTVFLGLAYGFGEHQAPVVFATLISGGVKDGEIWRYTSWEEAERGHAAAVSLAKLSSAGDDGGWTVQR